MSLVSITNQQRYDIGYRANIAANLTQRFVNNTKTLTAEQAAPIDAALDNLIAALAVAGYTTVPDGSVVVGDGDSIDVLNLNGTVTTAATVEVDADLGTAQVRFPATAAGVANGATLTGVEPTGTYTNTITFTVAGGVITGIALS